MKADATRRSRIGNTIVVATLLGVAAWWLLREPDLHGPTVGVKRWLAVAGVLATYALVCFVALSKARPGKRSVAMDEGTVLVVFATQTGFAEELAMRTAAALRSAGHRVTLLPAARLDAATLAATRLAFFIVATYGDGEPPDTTRRFAREVVGRAVALDGLRFGLLALGDRGYADFCAFGRAVERWLRDNGGRPAFASIDVDNGDGDALVAWFDRLKPWTGGSIDVLHSDSTPTFERWTLVSRRLANEGSVGAPTYHLAFEPVPIEVQTWQAGDIAVVRLPGGEQREYSIASLPSQDRVELLVRQAIRPDGRIGRGAQWLTTTMAIGDATDLRIRANHGFRLEGIDAETPLILIGNGTGIAGLRAHLLARIAAGARRNWLVFGERNAAFDDYYGREIGGWRDGGLVTLDTAFSRDGPDRVYVQHRLRAERATVAQWIADGAVVLVCGSADGMAGGVDAALKEIVGDAAVDDLMAAGRYRRDVY